MTVTIPAELVELLDDAALSLHELARGCAMSPHWVHLHVEAGVLQPLAGGGAAALLRLEHAGLDVQVHPVRADGAAARQLVQAERGVVQQFDQFGGNGDGHRRSPAARASARQREGRRAAAQAGAGGRAQAGAGSRMVVRRRADRSRGRPRAAPPRRPSGPR